MKRLLSSLVLALLLINAMPPGIQAAEGIGLSPSIRELQITEDQNEATFSVTVSNTTNETVDLRLSVLDFGSLDESGGVAFIGRTAGQTTNYGLSEWMVLEKDRLTLQSGQSQKVVVTVENRESLGPGGHYGAVIVTAGTPDDTQARSLSVLPAGSTLVLLKKSGGEKQELSLSSIKTNKSLLSLPNQVTLRFQNTGNVHLVPRGTVKLYSPTGSIVSSSVINPQSGFVLPESFRQFSLNQETSSQPWFPGRYKLEVNWRYDGKEDFETFVIHLWFIGKATIILFAAISLLIVLVMFRKWRKNPIIRGS